jgi:hypothetical protein
MYKLSLIVFFTIFCSKVLGQIKPHAGANVHATMHKIVVKEVLQTKNYTYLHGSVNDTDKWLAIPSIDAHAGEVYYYSGGMLMPDFESKELKRKFPAVIFLGSVTKDPDNTSTINLDYDSTKGPYKRKVVEEVKKEIKINSEAGCISIENLLAKIDSFTNKTVKIKGQVTKYTPKIMNKNWIHLQDGTAYKGKFEVVATTNSIVKIGQTIILEGKITRNKDFGYGYFFEVILEDAKIN